MRAQGIHHVSVNVSDVAASIAFYSDVLGAAVRVDRPDLGIDGAWLDVGDHQVHLIEAPTPPNLGQHFAVRVDDVAAVVAELRGKGLAVADAVRIGPGLQTFVEDPDGNVIELHQAPAG